MKKILSLILVFLLSISFFTGCTDSQSNSEQESIESGNSTSESEEENKPQELVNSIDTTNIVANIVENGASEYKIVQSRLPAANYAATEMQLFIKQSTGVELTIVADNKLDENGKYIAIGDTSLLKKANLGINYDSLNTDGFVVKTVGDDLLINGASASGTIYGVYDFLEKVMGVRFVTYDYTHVPTMETLPLYDIEIIDAPAFQLRNHYSAYIKDNIQYAVRNRTRAPEITAYTDRFGGQVGWYNKFNTIHNAFYWVPDSYLDEHPEFYARNSMGIVYKQTAPVLGSTYTGNKGYAMQLCLTNGLKKDGTLDETMELSVAKIAVESLKSFILEDKNANTFFFGHNDIIKRCQCLQCIEEEGKHGGASGLLVRFVNMLSDEIAKWMKAENIKRDITICTWAYLETENAPVKEVDGKLVPYNETVIPRENVAIRTAPIFLNWYYPMTSDKQTHPTKNIIDEWSVLTDNLMIWTYEDSFGAYLWYVPTTRTWSENLPYFKENNLSYVMLQDNYSGYGSWQADLRTYVGSKMLWNVELDVEELKDEFLNLYFGNTAAPYVKQMMEKFDKRNEWLSENVSNFTVYTPIASSVSWDITEWYSAEFMEECISLIEQAIIEMQRDRTISAKMSNYYYKHLCSAIATPYYMVLSNYNMYYGEKGKTEFAQKFFQYAEMAQILRISENYLLSTYKTQFGL